MQLVKNEETEPRKKLAKGYVPSSDNGDAQGRAELEELEAVMVWCIDEERPGVIRPDDAEDGNLGVYEISIDYDWNAEKKAMAYKACIQTCLECGNHNFFGRKEFGTLKEAVDWVEGELLSSLKELATRLGREVI